MIKFNLLLMIILLSTIGLCAVCHNKNESHYIIASHLDQDSLLIEKIYKLKEVQEKESYLQKISKGKGHIAIMIASKPSKKSPYYLIQVGYDNAIRFEVYFNFRINFKYVSQKNIIPYLDILDINSNYVKLVKWRNTNGKS